MKLEEFYSKWYSSLAWMSYKAQGNWQDAEDIVSSVFVRLFKVWDEKWSEDAARYYTFASVKNANITHLKRKMRFGEMPDEAVVKYSPDVTFHDEVTLQLIQLIYESIDGLQSESKKVIRAFLDGLPDEGIAVFLGKKEKTVRNIRNYAINRIKELLKKRALPEHIYFKLCKH